MTEKSLTENLTEPQLEALKYLSRRKIKEETLYNLYGSEKDRESFIGELLDSGYVERTQDYLKITDLGKTVVETKKEGNFYGFKKCEKTGKIIHANIPEKNKLNKDLERTGRIWEGLKPE